MVVYIYIWLWRHLSSPIYAFATRALQLISSASKKCSFNEHLSTPVTCQHNTDSWLYLSTCPSVMLWSIQGWLKVQLWPGAERNRCWPVALQLVRFQAQMALESLLSHCSSAHPPSNKALNTYPFSHKALTSAAQDTPCQYFIHFSDNRTYS